MNILVLLSRFPWPLEKGDKLRAYYQLRGLARRHEVHLLCLNEEPVSPAALAELDFCKSVQVVRQSKLGIAGNLLAGIFNGLPFQVNYFRSRKMRAAIAETVAREGIDAIFVQLIRLGMNLPETPGVATFLDYMDCFSIGMGNRVPETGWALRWLVRLEAQRLKRYEERIAAQFDGWGIISQRDADGLPPEVGAVAVIIPNGVGDVFFENLPEVVEKRYDLVFFGNMGYQPNVESARYLVQEVLPEVRKLGLDPSLCIAGARPAKLVQGFASERVHVTGFVDDIRSYVLSARLSIAPVIGGQGLQNKLLESMALGLPTLTTPMAFAGIADSGEEVLLVCEDAAAFAREIKRLLEDEAAAAAIGAAGKRFVESHYRWEAMNAQLEAALLAAVERAASAG